MLGWKRFAFPRVYEQHVVFDRARERKVRRVRNERAGHEIVAGTQYVFHFLFGNRKLGDRLESHPAPVILVAAPRRHAVKVADVLGLRQREELIPGERERIVDEAADVELPLCRRHVRLLSEIEDGPVLHLVLTDWQLRHPMLIRRAAAFRLHARELHVHRALVDFDLTLNVAATPLDQIVHFPILCAGPHIYQGAWGPLGALARALRSLGLKAVTHLSPLAYARGDGCRALTNSWPLTASTFQRSLMQDAAARRRSCSLLSRRRGRCHPSTRRRQARWRSLRGERHRRGGRAPGRA